MKLLKLLLAASLLLAFSSCSKIVDLAAPVCPKGITCAQTNKGWSIKADSTNKNFVIGFSQELLSYTSTAFCRKDKVTARVALYCEAPNEVDVVTQGKIQVLADPK